MVRARGIWSYKPRLTAEEWAFAQFHLLQDYLDEQLLAKAQLQHEMALHFMLKYHKPEQVSNAILDKPIEAAEDESEAEEFMRRAGDPYFGMLDLPELPEMATPGQMPPAPSFGDLESGFPQPPNPNLIPEPGTRNHGAGTGVTFPAFPIPS